MTKNVERAALKLSQAITSLNHAKGLIREALGESDIEYEYRDTINNMMEDLLADIEAIKAGVALNRG